MNEIRDKLRAIGRVHDFGMELYGVEAARFVGHRRIGRVLTRCDNLEPIWQARNAIAMAHPDLVIFAFRPHAVKQRAWRCHAQHGAAEFAVMPAFDLSAELLAHRLLAIANAKHRNASLEHGIRRSRRTRRRNGCGPARKNDSLGLQLGERRVRVLEGMDFAIDPGLAHAPRNKLRHLAAEVDDEDAIGMRHGNGLPDRTIARNAARGHTPRLIHGFCTVTSKNRQFSRQISKFRAAAKVTQAR